MVKNIFGAYQAEIDFSKWNGECDKLIIRDIEYDEDLLTVFQRLREDFWVRIETQTKEEKWGRRKTVYALLNIELILKDCYIKEKEKKVC